MTAPEPPAVRAALLMAKHSLDPDYRDADRNDACVCGGWVSGPMEPGWDDHLAEVLAEAGLLVPDTGADLTSAARHLLATHSLPNFGDRDRDLAWERLAKALREAPVTAPEQVMTETTRKLARRVTQYRRETLGWLKQAIRADGEAGESNNALIRERQIAGLTKGDGHIDCAIEPSPGAEQDRADLWNLWEAIDRVIGEWLSTKFALARAGFALSRPDQIGIEWVGHQALDEAQHLHLSGYPYSLTPKILDVLAATQPSADTVQAPDVARRLAIAQVVAEHWRDVAMQWGDDQIPGHAAAHPLACVLAAIAGETDELGVGPGPDADRIRVLLGTDTTPEPHA